MSATCLETATPRGRRDTCPLTDRLPVSSYPGSTLTSPADTLVINAGDTVLLKGSITDNKNLHELSLALQNLGDSAVLLNQSPYVHGLKEYKFSYTWITSTTPSVYKFTVDAHDHDGHEAEKDFFFSVN